jgi:hypothetical protein
MFSKYLSLLLPSFERSQVIASAETSRQVILEQTLPSISGAEKLYAGKKPTSKEGQALDKAIAAAVGNKPLFTNLARVLKKSTDILDFCIKYGEKAFANTETNRALTYPKVAVIRTVEASEYVSTYCRRMLNYFLVFETIASGGTTAALSSSEKLWVEQNLPDFCTALKSLDIEVDVFERMLKDLPDAVVSELADRSFSNVSGVGKIDPMNMRNFSAKINPFYLIRMTKAAWDAERYDSVKEERKMLQLRMMQLERQRDGKPDAKLDAQIEYLQNRITALNQKAEKMEKEWLNGDSK